MTEQYCGVVEIWGIKVMVGARGRRNWPKKLKNLATYKVLREGQTIKSIADELGTVEGVVARWVKAAKNIKAPAAGAQTFVEIEAIEVGKNKPAIEVAAVLKFSNIDICFSHPLDAKILSETAAHLADKI